MSGKVSLVCPYTHHIQMNDLDLEVIFLALDRPEDVEEVIVIGTYWHLD